MWLPAWLLFMAVAVGPISSENKSTQLRTKRATGEKRVVCYYTNWSVYRPGTAKFNPQNINPYLCTHLIYAFGGLSKENSLKPFDKYQDIEQGGYAKFNGLKTYNKELKTLLAIGGWNEGSARFSSLVADEDRRKEMVKNVLKFLRQNHFDGLDLDWEYPAFRDGGKARDRANYAAFVQELRAEFERESSKTGRSRLLLTMAVPAGIEYIDKGYDVPSLNENLDWFNILSYDYHSAFEPSVDHHAPLLPLEPDNEYNYGSQLNIDATVKHYLELGADRNKLVLGIPTYGRSYTLLNAEATDIGAPADGPGEQGDATREKGYLAYYEICENLEKDGWTVVNTNPEAMGPYAFKGNQWVGYDDEEIVKAKAKYVNENDLGGIMFWSIDNDDFRGKCSGKPYPLIEAAKEALLASSNEVPSREPDRESSSKHKNSESSKPKNRKSKPKSKTTTEAPRPTRTTPAYTTTTPQPPTTPDPGSDFKCEDEGFFPHPRDCKKYFWCLDSGPSSLGIVAHQFTCPSGLIFNKNTDSCDYPRNVVCKTVSKTTTAPSTTAAPTTTTARTTTSRSKVITSAARLRTTTTTTTTTTEEPEEYEDEETGDDEHEDPNAIKELIGLIKRLGGVEQLEKQLKAQEGATIKPSLFNKVLARSGNKYRGGQQDAKEDGTTTRYQSSIRSRGPQNSGLEAERDTSGSRQQEKPQYVTIQRNRPLSRKPAEESKESDESESEEEVVTPKSRRQPSGTKEYTSLQRNNARNNAETTTTKYKSIFRTRSTTEIPEETSDESSEEEASSIDRAEVEQPRKYSSVYREKSKNPKESEDDVEDEEVKVRPPTSAQETTTTVNNVNKYVEFRRKRPETTVNNNKSPEVSPVTNETPIFYSVSPQYATIRRRPVTEDGISTETSPIVEVVTTPKVFVESSEKNEVFGSATDKIAFGSEKSEVSSTTLKDELSNFVERRNDVPENRRRTRPPILTTQIYVEPTLSTSNVPSRTPPPSIRRSTTSEKPTEISEPPRRFQFAPRTRPTLTPPEKFTIVVPETMIPDWAATEIIQTTTEEVKDERKNLPTTAFQKMKSTAQPFTTSTETSVVTSITESSYTERQKIMVTKKPTVFKKTTTEKPVSSSSRPLFRVTRPYKPEKPAFSTTTQATEHFSSRTSSRFRPRTTTVSTVETTEHSRKFTPKRRAETEGRGRFRPTEEVITEKNKFSPQRARGNSIQTETTSENISRGRSRNFSRLNDVTNVHTTTEGRGRFRSVEARSRENLNKDEISSENTSRGRSRNLSRFEDSLTTTTPLADTTKRNDFRRKLVARRLKNSNTDLDSQQSSSYYDDSSEDDVGNKYILGESLRKTSAKYNLTLEVIFATVPTVESEELSAITETTDLSTVKTKSRTNVTVFRGNARGSGSFRVKKVKLGEKSQKVNRVNTETYREDSTSQNELPKTRLNVPFEESSPKPQKTKPSAVFRGTKKAEESLIENVPDDYKKKIRKVVHRRKKPKTTQETPVVTEDYFLILEDSNLNFAQEVQTTTQEPSTTRRASQQFLTNLRTRNRSTTTTTEAPAATTERAQRRPAVGADRRRRFRPERTTTAKPDSISDGTSTSQRSSAVIRRRRPVSTTTTTTTEAPQSEEPFEGRDLDIDLPDLADPAVVAIHNLATAVRESATLAPQVDGFSGVPFTASPRPFQETSGRSFTPAFRDPSFFSSNASPFRETSPERVTPARTVATSFMDIQMDTSPVAPTRLYSPTTTARGFALEAEDTPSTRNEVIIAPRRKTTTAPPEPVRSPPAVPVAPPVPVRSPQRKLKPFAKVPKPSSVQIVSKPDSNQFDYYDDADSLSLADVPVSALKVKVHSDGYIECLDQGNFPHPFSCKKFISCAKMENTDLLGWEYTCPKHLSFDPVGGICNWSAGLGCQH